MRTLYDVLALLTPVRSYLEIGVQEGESLRTVVQANAATLTRVVACDTWGPQHGGTNRQSHAHIAAILAPYPQLDVCYLDGPSGVLLPTLGDERFELVLVDGDHSYEGALSDLKLAGFRAQRLLVVHDLYFPPVAQACRDYFGEIDGAWTKVEVILDTPGTVVAYR